MTEDQIKAIAEYVAHLRAFDGGFFPKEKEIREDYEVLLQWLNEKYCIVEKEKVFNEYNKAKETLKDPFHDFEMCHYQRVTEIIEKLLGPDLSDSKNSKIDK